MSLKLKAINGVKWTSSSALVLSISQFIQLIVITRYLAPEEFGLVATLMVFIGFFKNVLDLGISKAIVHFQSTTSSQLSSLFWLNLSIGLLLFFLTFLTSSKIAYFFNEVQLEVPLKVASLVFIFVAIGSQYRALFQKNLLYDFIAQIEIVLSIISTLSALILAVNGAGIYSLILPMLLSQMILNITIFKNGRKRFHKPKFHFKYHEIKHIMNFGYYQLGEKGVNYFSNNIDKLLIAKFIGMDALGIYDLAWKLISYPSQVLNPIINKVAFPIYSLKQTDKDILEKYYQHTIILISLITVPFLIYLTIFSEEIIGLVFDPEWGEVNEILLPMCLIGLIRAFGNPGGSLLLALGYANVCFWWNLSWSLILTSVLFLLLTNDVKLFEFVYYLMTIYLTIGLVWHYLISYYSEINYIIIVREYFCVFITALIIVLSSKYITVSIISSNTSFNQIVLSLIICVILYVIYLLKYYNKILNLK